MVEPGPIGGSLWPSPSSSCHVFIWPNKRVLPSRVPDFGTDKNLSTFLAAVKKTYGYSESHYSIGLACSKCALV